MSLSCYIKWLCFAYYQCAENKVLQEKLLLMEQQLASISGGKIVSTSEMCVSDECTDELRKKVQSQVRCFPFTCSIHDSLFVQLV